MNLREEILKEHSKAQRQKIVDWVGHSQKRFDELFSLFINDHYRVIQRASSPISYSILAHPEFIINKLGLLLDNLSKENIHSAVKRNTIRIFETIDVPKKYHGRIINYCCTYLSDPKDDVAIKSYAITVLQKYISLYPDLLHEFKLLVEDNAVNKPSYKVRAKKFFNLIINLK